MPKFACPDCGLPVKNNRGLMKHIDAGCPRVIVRLFLDGLGFQEIAKRFKKPLHRVENIVRLEAIRRAK